jgi:hypothetical protein
MVLLTYLKKCKMSWGQNWNRKIYGGQNWNKKKYGAKLGYDSCPYLISLNHKNANSPGIRILLVKDDSIQNALILQGSEC